MANKNKIKILEKSKKINANAIRAASAPKNNILANSESNNMENEMDTSVSNIINPDIPLSERFGTLEDISNNTQKRINRIKSFCPPIVVQGSNYKTTINLLNTYKINDYSLKIISVGIKITVQSSESFNILKEKLIESKIEFFSFSPIYEIPLKILIFGLPSTITTDDIKNSLIEQGITSEDIFNIQPIYYKNNTDKIKFHLLKLNKQNIPKQKILNINIIMRVIVKMKLSNNFINHPTQCRRCQMYGHGTSYCYKKIKCLNCGENHENKDCPTPALPKCANCSGDHLANSKTCPKLDQYKLVRENVNINRQINNLERVNGTKTHNWSNRNYHIDQQNSSAVFPVLQPPRKTFLHNNWESTFTKHKPIQQANTSKQNTNNTASTTHFDDQLFSLDEITALIKDIISQVSSCKSRSEQYLVITIVFH